MTLSEQYEIINEFRKTAPVDVRAAAEAVGVTVREAYLPSDVSGMLERDGKGHFVITVNASHPSTRKRFTIAHELGHYMLHRHLVGDGVDDDRAYRSTNVGKYHNTRIGPREETEANKFAASVLMPLNLIKELQSKGVTSPAALARQLGVSEHAMCIRLGVPYQPSEGAAYDLSVDYPSHP